MDTKKYITYLLLFVLICIIIIIYNGLYNQKNEIETFSTITNNSATYGVGEKGTWTVPVGVAQATFTIIGGKGGNGSNGGKGGYGANVTTTLYGLIAGKTYNIYVGNNGGDSNNGSSCGIANSSDTKKDYSGGAGGFGSGCGGSASFISDSNDTPLIVAGGGGGGGFTNIINTNGGNGGIDQNGTGGNGNGFECGGSGGSSTNSSSKSGGGGAYTCGGGGGGYYSGGGGKNIIKMSNITGSGGGGAGSSYVIPTSSSNINYTTDITGIPSIQITWITPTATLAPNISQLTQLPAGVLASNIQQSSVTSLLPKYFTINYPDPSNSGNLLPWLYDNTNDTVNLKTGSPIILSVFNDSSVYNNNLGAVGLQNNNNPSNLKYIRHANYILHSNTFTPRNYDFSWVFNPVNVNSDGSGTYQIYNYYGLPSKYYIGIDNNKNVLITTNTPIVNWAIKKYIAPTITQALTKIPDITISTNPTNPLVPILSSSNNNLNDLRFSWIDNQQRLDKITDKINKVKNSLSSLASQSPMYSASGKMTFY